MNHTFYGAASITGAQRSQIIRKESIPGPGTYDPSLQDQQRIPNWTLKPKIQFTSCFHSTNSFVPAPGTYNIATCISSPFDQKNSKQKNSKNIRYKERNVIEKSSPVIQLQLPSFVDQLTGYSFGYRDEVVVHQHSPGPIYNVNELSDESRKKKIMNSSTGFGLGQRSRIEKQEVPGPGNYNPSPDKLYSTSGKWSFSKSLRKDKFHMSNPTGPGQYNPQMMTTCRAFKLKGRHPQTKSDCLDISPQSYNLPDTKSKRGAVFQRSSSKLNLQKQAAESPSPFSYNVSGNASKSGGFSLGRKIHAADYSIQNPGPGSYENDNQLFAKNGGFISKKQKTKKKIAEQTDNFYKYNPKLDSVSFKYPQFTFKQSKGLPEQKNPQLGPGTYTSSFSLKGGQSYTIGKNIRFKMLQKQKSCISLSKQGSNYNLCGYIPNYLKTKKNVKSSTLKTNVSDKQNSHFDNMA